jgi:hypothetical protein
MPCSQYGFHQSGNRTSDGVPILTNAPFTIPAMDSKYTYQKVIVLFTDGLNTSRPVVSVWSFYKRSIHRRPAKNYLRQHKGGWYYDLHGAGSVLTVRPSSTLLRDCASDPGKFFFMTNATDLVTIFTQIGTNLSRLRLAK